MPAQAGRAGTVVASLPRSEGAPYLLNVSPKAAPGSTNAEQCTYLERQLAGQWAEPAARRSACYPPPTHKKRRTFWRQRLRTCRHGGLEGGRRGMESLQAGLVQGCDDGLASAAEGNQSINQMNEERRCRWPKNRATVTA